jgi:hypothetical protein
VAIRRWKPWERSTGPKTPEGKTRAAQNANKGHDWTGIRRVAAALHRNQQALDELSVEDLDAMTDKVVAATLDGDFRTIQKIAEAIDE